MKSLSLMLALCMAVCCCAKEYFVAVNGDDKGPGSKEKPFRNINRALQKLTPGDIVTIRGGVYREQVLMKHSGTPEKPIILRGAPGETVLISSGFPVKGEWKKVDGYRYIYENSFPYAISILFDSILINRYLEVENMELLDKTPGGYLHDKKSGKLYINTFTGRNPNTVNVMATPWWGGRDDAGFSGGRTGSNLLSYKADIRGLYRWNKGIMVTGSNVILENFHMAFWPGQGIRVNAPAKNVIVRKNTVFGGTCGIMLYGAVENCKILNNRVFRVAGAGIQLSGGGTKCLVKDNYVFNCGTCSPFKAAKEASSGNIFNIAHYGSYSYTDIIGNVVVSTDKERCGKTLMRNKGAIRKHTTQTGNVFYGGGVSLYAAEQSTALLSNNTCYQGQINIGKLKTGNKYTPVMKDNLFIRDKKDPGFADVYHRDFRLRADSPHLGKGAFPKVGSMLYVKPAGKGDGSTPAKASSLAAALQKIKGKNAVVYMLPGVYSGKAAVSCDVKIANYEGGKVTVDKGVFSGKGNVTFDGIIFTNSTVALKGSVLARRSVFDKSKVNAAKAVFENCTFRSSGIAGVITMRNSFVCGTGNSFAFAGMVSENNCFNVEKALAAFLRGVKEVHKSFFRSVKLNADYSLPADSNLSSAGLDCSDIGGRGVAPFKQSVAVENLNVKQLSPSSALVSWDTPRHYCSVNVRIKCVENRKMLRGGSSQQESLRSTHGEVLLQNLIPGNTYQISCYFYPINGDRMESRNLTFKVSPKYIHKAVTLVVDQKAPGAFRTIGEALLKAGEGDTILVSPGVYTEELNIYLNKLTLKSRVPGKAYLNVAERLNYAVKVVRAKGVTVDGFQFIGLPYSASRKALWISGTENFTLRNCYFHRPDSGRGVSNIQFLGHSPEGVLVENCVFDSGFHGIWIYPGKDVTIRNCTFFGNGVNAIHVGCEQGWKTQIYNNIFQDVVSNHHSPAVTVAEHGPHVYCDYNIYWKTQRAPRQCYYAFGRHKPGNTYSAPWTIMKKNQPETLKETQRRFGIEKHAIEADPCFADTAKADFTLKPGSPALKGGRDGRNIGADFSIFK